jgi:hypothetical protein
MPTLESTQATIAHPSAPAIVFLSAVQKCTYRGSGQVYEIRAIYVDPHRRQQFQTRLPSTRLDGVLYVADDVRSSLQRLWKSYAMIQLWIRISVVYWWAEFKIVEQRSQILLQLRMGSIISAPWNVLKWLADTIRDYYCQFSALALDWTAESDLCDERDPSEPTLFHFVKQSQRKLIKRQRANMVMCPYDGIWGGFLAIQ